MLGPALQADENFFSLGIEPARHALMRWVREAGPSPLGRGRCHERSECKPGRAQQLIKARRVRVSGFAGTATLARRFAAASPSGRGHSSRAAS